ncbi:MAG: FAD-binding protein, partial [Marivirga sp.]|nr:FAD-binding protein [Marivirga sp.]
MKKRTFLKISSALVTGAALSPFAACTPEKQKEKMKNWAGNLTYGTTNIFEPATTEEVQEIIRKCDSLRVLGTRHCFNRIADSDTDLISTRNLNKIYTLDKEARTITVGAGIRYGEFCNYLHEQGFAIHNLASLPHISVAGACATATHGSGVANGNLATPVAALEMVTGKGEVITVSRELDRDVFNGLVVGLGTLGLVTKVTLDIIPAFSVRQNVYLNLPMSQLEAHFDEIMSSGYSVSLFTDWQSDINQIWIKRVVTEGEPFTAEPEYFGAKLADRNVHPIIEISAENCTEQMGIPGPWYDRLPHFKMGFTPSSGEELQAEFFVPRQNAVEAIKAVATLRDEIKPVLMITEIRTIDADNLWMSPCYHQPSVAIHFTLNPDPENVNKLLPKIEDKLASFGVKPHWG